MFRILEFETFKPLCEVDTYLSYSYALKFGDIDNLILQVQKDNYYQHYKKDNIIYFNKDTFFFIKSIEEKEEAGATVLTINAVSPLFIFAQRLCYPPFQETHFRVADNVETIMKSLVWWNVTNARDTDRVINYFAIRQNLNRGETLNYSCRYNNLLEQLLKLAEYGRLNITTELDVKQKKIWFSVAEPVERTEKDIVVFSRNLENVIDRTIYYDELEEKNTAIVGDYLEGLDRTFYTKYYSDNKKTGWDRKEIFIDGSGFQPDKENPSDNYISEMLDNTALQLLDLRTQQNVEFVLGADSYFKPFIHFNLGDIVWLIDKELGIKEKIRIVEIRTSENAEGKMVELTLGTPFKSRANLFRDNNSIK